MSEKENADNQYLAGLWDLEDSLSELVAIHRELESLEFRRNRAEQRVRAAYDRAEYLVLPAPPWVIDGYVISNVNADSPLELVVEKASVLGT